MSDDVRRQRLDLQSVDADDAETLVHQIVGERVAGRPETGDEDVLAVIGQRMGPADIQRIPPREQSVDLDAPRQLQHVGQHAGFDFRDVDRVLLLVDARLHAVVADAMAGARAHRVVQHDERERADRVAGLPQLVHLGNVLIERASAKLDAKRVDAGQPF